MNRLVIIFLRIKNDYQPITKNDWRKVKLFASR